MILVIYIISILQKNYTVEMLKLYGWMNLKILQLNKPKKRIYIVGKTYKIACRVL